MKVNMAALLPLNYTVNINTITLHKTQDQITDRFSKSVNTG